jgi:hypothetical protein
MQIRLQILVLTALVVGAGESHAARAQSGLALDWATHAPIAGARITLDCERDPWFQPEGHVHLRTVTRITDAAGRYSFSFLDRLGCSVIYVHGDKDGFSGSMPSGADELAGRSVPTIAYLVKTSDRVWLELQSITPGPSMQVRNPDGSESLTGLYIAWFQPFFKAKRIATTPREVAFVHEHYCAKLLGLYAALTDADNAHVARLAVEETYGGKYLSAKSIDHAAEVLPYCVK